MNIISSKNLTKKFIERVFQLADNFKELKSSQKLNGKILTNLFFEPSTRTKISFESAMLKLGGNVINIEDKSKLAIERGESLKDTIKTISKFSDIIVIRNSDLNFCTIDLDIPIINAGNYEEHPTQSLLDLYTIKNELGKIDNIKILFIGDLLYGRTIHSLIYILSKLKNIKIYFTSPNNLKLPNKYKEYLKKKKIYYKEIEDWKGILSEIDVLYTNRIKREKFQNTKEYENTKKFFKINNSVLNRLNNNAIIMHPLPRTEEIPEEVDKDKRAVYFNQAENGLFVRMALLSLLLRK